MHNLPGAVSSRPTFHDAYLRRVNDGPTVARRDDGHPAHPGPTAVAGRWPPRSRGGSAIHLRPPHRPSPPAAAAIRGPPPGGGHVESHVLLRLGHLDHGEAAGRTEPAGAADALVGALDGFDRQRGLVLDGHALAHVEPSHLLGHLPAELDVFLLPGVRAAAGEVSGADQQLGGVVGRRGEADALGGELVDDGQQQRVVAAVLLSRPEVRQKHADRAQVGQVPQPGPAMEEPGLENLAGHGHFGDPPPPKVADARAELRQPQIAKLVADLRQRRIGVTDHPQAIDFAPLPTKASAITTG